MQSNPTDFNPASPESYAMVMADQALQKQHQDTLDAFFHDRIISVRNELLSRGWGYIADSNGPNSPLLLKGDAVFNTVFRKVGAGANVVGLSYEIDRKPMGADDLTKTPEQLASEIDAAATNELVLQSLVNDFGWTNQGGSNRLLHWVTKDIGGGLKSGLNPDGIRRVCARIGDDVIRATLGDDALVSVTITANLTPAQKAKALDGVVNAVDPNQTRDVSEYYQWQRNKQSGQEFGNQKSIVPLTKSLFDEHVAACVRIKDFDVYQDAYPDVTHLELIKKADGRIISGGIGSLYELRPSRESVDKGWVVRVDSFDSEVAIAHGQSADQEDDEEGSLRP